MNKILAWVVIVNEFENLCVIADLLTEVLSKILFDVFVIKAGDDVLFEPVSFSVGIEITIDVVSGVADVLTGANANFLVATMTLLFGMSVPWGKSMFFPLATLS